MQAMASMSFYGRREGRNEQSSICKLSRVSHVCNGLHTPQLSPSRKCG
ncbi:unnamed protein product, partial [Prunus brigantina]